MNKREQALLDRIMELENKNGQLREENLMLKQEIVSLRGSISSPVTITSSTGYAAGHDATCRCRLCS